MKPIILVIDDDDAVRDLLRRGLIYEGFRVVEARDGQGGLRAAREQPPDLVVLDVMMPGLDGYEVCRRLREAGPVPILFLSARDQVADRVKGLDIGGDDFLTKPFDFEELIARIRALLRRRANEAPEVLAYGDLRLDTRSRLAYRGQRRIELTTTEYKLLELFLRRPEQVLTRDLILEQVWGWDFEGESNVLEVYVRYLRSKLEHNGEPRLIQTVRGAGYVLRQA